MSTTLKNFLDKASTAFEQGKDFTKEQLQVIKQSFDELPLKVTVAVESVTVEALLPGVAPEVVDAEFVKGDVSTRFRVTVLDEKGSRSSSSVEVPRNISINAAKAVLERGVLTVVAPRLEEATPEVARLSVA